MSKHGRVIISRMVALIGAYEAGRVPLRSLVDDLASMYESLEPPERPPKRDWLDAFIPVDRAVSDGEGSDRQRIRRRIEEHLGQLRSMLSS